MDANQLMGRAAQYLELFDDINNRQHMGTPYAPARMSPAAAEVLIYARDCYLEALRIAPPGDLALLFELHNEVGFVYRLSNALDYAYHHFYTAIQLAETTGDKLRAGQAKHNLALALFENGGQPGQAYPHAIAALADFQQSGPEAAGELEAVNRLVATILASR